MASFCWTLVRGMQKRLAFCSFLISLALTSRKASSFVLSVPALQQQFSECGAWTSSINITRELVQNAFAGPTIDQGIRNSGTGAQQNVLQQTFCHSSLLNKSIETNYGFFFPQHVKLASHILWEKIMVPLIMKSYQTRVPNREEILKEFRRSGLEVINLQE